MLLYNSSTIVILFNLHKIYTVLFKIYENELIPVIQHVCR